VRQPDLVFLGDHVAALDVREDQDVAAVIGHDLLAAPPGGIEPVPHARRGRYPALLEELYADRPENFCRHRILLRTSRNDGS